MEDSLDLTVDLIERCWALRAKASWDADRGVTVHASPMDCDTKLALAVQVYGPGGPQRHAIVVPKVTDASIREALVWIMAWAADAQAAA